MNPEQTKSFVRGLLASIGGAIGGFAVGRNWITPGQAAQFTTWATSEVVVAAVFSVGSAAVAVVWGLFTHTDKNAVAVVDAIAKQPDSPVKAVLVEPTPEGLAIASSLPGTTTVPAGTAQAVRLAKDEPVRNVA